MYLLKVSQVSGFGYDIVETVSNKEGIDSLIFKANVIEFNRRHKNIRWVITDDDDKIIEMSNSLKTLLDEVKASYKRNSKIRAAVTDIYFKRLLSENKIPYYDETDFAKLLGQAKNEKE